MQHVLESFLLKVHHKKSFSITTKDDCGVVLLDESEAVNYTYHTLVEYFDCECRALFGYNTKQKEMIPLIAHCWNDPIDVVRFKHTIHRMKITAEMERRRKFEKVDRRSKNSRRRRKEKNVKREYKVPPKEDKSVEEIMHDLQMAALDEVD